MSPARRPLSQGSYANAGLSSGGSSGTDGLAACGEGCAPTHWDRAVQGRWGTATDVAAVLLRTWGSGVPVFVELVSQTLFQIGSGTQPFPWIHITDAIVLMKHALTTFGPFSLLFSVLFFSFQFSSVS